MEFHRKKARRKRGQLKKLSRGKIGTRNKKNFEQAARTCGRKIQREAEGKRNRTKSEKEKRHEKRAVKAGEISGEGRGGILKIRGREEKSKRNDAIKKQALTLKFPGSHRGKQSILRKGEATGGEALTDKIYV